MNEICYKPIGVVRSPFKDPVGTPIQSAAARGVEGTVEIFPEYADGLRDVDGFSHLILIYHFHLCRESSLLVRPYLDSEPHGVFATRAPVRPNPIGVSIVRLVRLQETTLHIRDVDILDGTPVLDIKPYVPEFDVAETESMGWLRDRIAKLGDTTDDGRFSDRSIRADGMNRRSPA
jgi:tRNA-Thr(GGU) m(6)t(6)A37 methyltransferase TsaA